MPSSGGRIISSGANLGPSVSAGPMSYHGQWKAAWACPVRDAVVYLRTKIEHCSRRRGLRRRFTGVGSVAQRGRESGVDTGPDTSNNEVALRVRGRRLKRKFIHPEFDGRTKMTSASATGLPALSVTVPSTVPPDSLNPNKKVHLNGHPLQRPGFLVTRQQAAERLGRDRQN